MADDHGDFKGFCRFGIRSGELDVAHFFTHQILDDADFGDLIGSANFDCPDLLVGQKFVCQLSADASEHLAEVIYLHDFRVSIKHGVFFIHGDASYAYWNALPTTNHLLVCRPG